MVTGEIATQSKEKVNIEEVVRGVLRKLDMIVQKKELITDHVLYW